MVVESTGIELAEDLRAIGVEGRHSMYHCSYKSLIAVAGGPQAVVDAILAAVGPLGTALFCTYDFQTFPQDHYWDIDHTPSKMGIITELARQDPRTERTPHPIFSYAAYGGTQYMENVPNCMGRNSVFDVFIKNDGILVSLGGLSKTNPGFAPGNVGFSQIHHSEFMTGKADWRFLKWFGGIYMDRLGHAKVREYSMNVKKPGVVTRVSPAMEYMQQIGVIQEVRIGRSRSQVGNAREVHEATMRIVEERPELLRVFE